MKHTLKNKITLYKYINDILDFWTTDDKNGKPLKILNQCLENTCSFYCNFIRNFTNEISIINGAVFVEGCEKPMFHIWNKIKIGRKYELIDVTKIYMDRIGMKMNYVYKENIDGYSVKHKYNESEMIKMYKNGTTECEIGEFILIDVKTQKEWIDKLTKLYDEKMHPI